LLPGALGGFFGLCSLPGPHWVNIGRNASTVLLCGILKGNSFLFTKLSVAPSGPPWLGPLVAGFANKSKRAPASPIERFRFTNLSKQTGIRIATDKIDRHQNAPPPSQSSLPLTSITNRPTVCSHHSWPVRKKQPSILCVSLCFSATSAVNSFWQQSRSGAPTSATRAASIDRWQ